ncbi:MAG: thioesterase family protein [Chitinophagaceae bacterium]
MSRIKLEQPDSYSFSVLIPIRITDINYGGHAGNDSIVSLIHEARLQFLEHHGFKELALGGVGLIMSDLVVEFKAELFYGDKVKISVTANDFSRIGFDLLYKFEKETSDKKIIAVMAKTSMICYDYGTKKVAGLPEDVKQKLA